MDYLRRSARTSRTYKGRNETIRTKKMGIKKDILQETEEQQ
jgi:hypothetical protein